MHPAFECHSPCPPTPLRARTWKSCYWPVRSRIHDHKAIRSQEVGDPVRSHNIHFQLIKGYSGIYTARRTQIEKMNQGGSMYEYQAKRSTVLGSIPQDTQTVEPAKQKEHNRRAISTAPLPSERPTTQVRRTSRYPYNSRRVFFFTPPRSRPSTLLLKLLIWSRPDPLG
ncbi:hypothetical protein BC834DRAFT_907263 [Gloeopeniophorella convolvens]|nr:hypothetical protein BC834DRAFT_907263 [Gloeopeniophorella convolvens]